MRASGGSDFQGFQFLLGSGHVNLLVDAELHDLLEAVHHVGALRQQQQDVRIGGAGFDEVGRKIAGPERGEFVPRDGAAELLQVGGAGVVERVAECIIRRDEVPFLAVLAEQQVGDRIRFHAGGVAHAIDVPLAILAGDAVGVPARDDVQHLLLGGDLGDGLGNAGIHVTDDERDLVALDQLAGLLDTGADVVCGILHQKLDRAPQHAALRVDLLDGKLCADQFVLRHGGINPRERIYHADADRRFAARRDDERRRDLQGTGCGGAFEHGATIE